MQEIPWCAEAKRDTGIITVIYGSSLPMTAFSGVMAIISREFTTRTRMSDYVSLTLLSYFSYFFSDSVIMRRLHIYAHSVNFAHRANGLFLKGPPPPKQKCRILDYIKRIGGDEMDDFRLFIYATGVLVLRYPSSSTSHTLSAALNTTAICRLSRHDKRRLATLARFEIRIS